MTSEEAIELLTKFNGHKILKPDEHKQIAALIARQQRMIDAACEIMGNAFCVEDGPCPENYIEVGCKPCVLKWLEGEATKC